MPIYEYRCDNCGTEFEEIYANGHGTIEPHCPFCYDIKAVHRIMSAPGVAKLASPFHNMYKKTGSKGFEMHMPNGDKLPMYNKYRG